jgi:hypothetical protein
MGLRINIVRAAAVVALAVGAVVTFTGAASAGSLSGSAHVTPASSGASSHLSAPAPMDNGQPTPVGTPGPVHGG